MKKIAHLTISVALCGWLLPAQSTAQWQPDVRLTMDDSISILSLNNARPIAAGPAGDLHVVWQDMREGGFPMYRYSVYYKRSSDQGATWSQDVRIDRSPILPCALDPSVVVSGQNVHVVWADKRDTNPSIYEIYYTRSTDGGVSWPNNDVRFTYNPAQSFRPSVAAWGSNVHVVWFDSRDTTARVYYKRSTDDGVTWDADEPLSRHPGGYPDGAHEVSISVSGSKVHVVWWNNNHEVYYVRSTDNGTTWSQDTCLSLADSMWSIYPSVSSTDSAVHVVWMDLRDGGFPNYEVYYKRSTDDGRTWSNDERLTFNPDRSLFPAVAASGSNVHVVWVDSSDGKWVNYYARSIDGGTSWSQAAISADPAEPYYYGINLALADSMVHIVWADWRDGNWEIYYKRNPTGNSGVEEQNERQPIVKSRRLKANPNPFSFYAKVPGHEKERFVLYDVSGRLLGTYEGDRVGADVPPGVYFLRAATGNAAPMRIVKVR